MKKATTMVTMGLVVIVALGLGARAAHAQAANADLFGKKTTEFYDAMKKKDAAGLGALLADDVAYTSATGDVIASKATYIDTLAKFLTVEAYTLKPVLVHIYGDTAIAVYRVTLQAKVAGGKDWNPELAATDTWLKQAGAWKMVAHHVSPVLRR